MISDLTALTAVESPAVSITFVLVPKIIILKNNKTWE